MSEISIQFDATGILRPVLASFCILGLVACEGPPPRSFSEYLEDAIAREGTLARCNADRAASFDDLECNNARRAASAIAAQAEAKRRAQLEAESERKRAAARERIAAQQEAARQAAEAARRAAEAAYEAQFLYGGSKLETIQPPATDGEPAISPPGAGSTLPADPATQTGSNLVQPEEQLAHPPFPETP